MTQATDAGPQVLIVRRGDGLRPALRRRLERAGFRIANLRGGRGRKGLSSDPLQALAAIIEHLGLEGHLLHSLTVRPASATGVTTARSGSAPGGGALSSISLDAAGLEHVEIAEEGISLDEVERALLCRALEQTGGNQTRAARLLGISRQTLIYRMEKYEIGRRRTP